MVDTRGDSGIICVQECPNEMIPCGLFCVPILAPVCNPMIALKSFDSLHIGDRKLKYKTKTKDKLHPDMQGGMLGGFLSKLNPFGNELEEEELNDLALDLELKLKAQEIATWSDWSYPICAEEGTH